MNEEVKKKNMEFWNSVCKTNPAETKSVEYPFKHTAIGAQFQLKHATEQWGIMGVNWGVKNEKFTPIMLDTEEKGYLIYTAILYYPKYYIDHENGTPETVFGQVEIHADINFYNKTKNGYKVENDISKKVATDALTKGLSKLGFNSDVFEGLFDDNKYVDAMRKEFSAPPEDEKEKGDIESIREQIIMCDSLKAVNALSEQAGKMQWTKEERTELKQMFDAKRGKLK